MTELNWNDEDPEGTIQEWKNIQWEFGREDGYPAQLQEFMEGVPNQRMSKR